MQNTQINAASVPFNYQRCITSSCPVASSCLRSIAWRELRGDADRLTVLNPSLATETSDCPYFVSNVPERYAVGFTGMQERMFPAQYERFMNICRSHFGRNGYFVRRRGEQPLPPSEQRLVREALDRVGAAPDLDFDGYEERVNWSGE